MSMPSCYDIFRYWQDKGITENGEVSDTGGRSVVANKHLPQCWACGRPVDRKAVLSWDKYDLEVEDIWRDKRVGNRLQRCHIIAKQFGGSNDTSNLFLLCEDCHALSPDTKNRASFFRWVYRRRSEFIVGHDFVGMMRELPREIKSRGYEVEAFVKEWYDLPSHETGNLVDEAFSMVGFHSTSIADSSVVAALVDVMERKVMNARKQKSSLA